MQPLVCQLEYNTDKIARLHTVKSHKKDGKLWIIGLVHLTFPAGASYSPYHCLYYMYMYLCFPLASSPGMSHVRVPRQTIGSKGHWII